MLILAFDLGATCGIALGRPGGRPALSSRRVGGGNVPHGGRFLAMQKLTRDIVDRYGPDRIVIEMPIAAGVKGSQERVQLAMGYRAAVSTIAYARNIPFSEFSVMSIRKHFIGGASVKRAPAKAATIARATALGWSPKDEDAADAAAVWDYTCAHFAPEIHCATPQGGLFDRSA